MRGLRRLVFLLGVTVVLLAMSLSVAAGATAPGWKSVQIAHSDVYPIELLAIDGSRLVWGWTDGDGYGLYTATDGGQTPYPVAWSPYPFESVGLSGDRVVWITSDGAHKQVFTRQMVSDWQTTQVTSEARDHSKVSASGDRLVWLARVGTYDQVCTQRIGVDAQALTLTTESATHIDPVVSGDRVAWIGSLVNARYIGSQLFTRNMATDSAPTRLTNAGAYTSLVISGDQIAYTFYAGYGNTDNRERVGSMSLASGASGMASRGGDDYVSDPKVSATRVIWRASSGVKMWHLGEDWHEWDLCKSAVTPELSGDRTVWVGSASAGDGIVTQVLGTDDAPSNVTIGGATSGGPLLSGDTVAWVEHDAAADTYDLLTATPVEIRVPWIDRIPAKSNFTLKRKRGRATLTLSCRMGDLDGTFAAGKVVYLQTSKYGSSWKTAYRVTTNSAGVARKALTFKKKGLTYVRWYAPERDGYSASNTAPQRIRVK